MSKSEDYEDIEIDSVDVTHDIRESYLEFHKEGDSVIIYGKENMEKLHEFLTRRLGK